MLVHDQQKPAARASELSGEGVATDADSAEVDNPLDREASRKPPTASRALREAASTEMILDAIFLGADAVALVEIKTIKLHSLTDARQWIQCCS
jgi:hypothetical protein